MICYYHSADLDGKASAAIMKGMFPHVELIPLDYGDDYKSKIFDRNFRNETIYFVDVTLQPKELMIELDKENQVYIIDHHISAIDEIKALHWEPHGVLKVGTGACQLTWELLFFTTAVPRGIKYLADYDIWDKTDPNAELFQYGMRLLDPEPDDPCWNLIFGEDDEFIDKVIEDGKLVQRWNYIKNKKIAKMSFRELPFLGMRAVVINGYDGSPLFDSVFNPKKHDIMISYIQRSDGSWQYGFYSDKPDIDCSEVAKRFGGGGHRGASGANTSKLLF